MEDKHDIRRIIDQVKGDTEAGEPPIKAFTEEVEPNIYHVEIKPEQWEKNLSIVECTIEVPGIHQSCICHVYPDDDMVLNKASDRVVANQLLKDIYDGEKLMIETDIGRIKCRFIGEAPTESIYLDLEELPFFDVPASKLGL